MKSILSLALLLTFVGIKAQNNLVVFSENGEKFFLIINGVKQNIEAETNVKVTDLIQPNYKAKIVFEDKAKGVVDQNIYFMDGGEPVKNYEFVYSVGLKKKGTYKVRPVSTAAIGTQTKSNPDQTVVHYATSEPTPSNNNVINVADDGTATNNTDVQTQQTVTQTQTSYDPNGSVNLGIKMDANGVNINMSDGMGTGSMTTTTSQTVTTTKSSTGTSSNKTATAYANEKKGSDVACAPMNDADFKSAKESIGSKSIDDAKLRVAKQVLSNNCISSDQVKEVMGLFSFEQSKLDFAKYAYSHTSDKKNYYKVSDVLTFQSSVTDLDNYIKKSNSGSK